MTTHANGCYLLPHHDLRFATRRLDVAQPSDDMKPTQVRFPSKGTASVRTDIVACCRATREDIVRVNCVRDLEDRRRYTPNNVQTVGVQSAIVTRSAGLSSLDRSADEKCELTHHNRLQYMHCNAPAERPAGTL